MAKLVNSSQRSSNLTPLVTDDCVYALTARGQIVGAFQFFEDAQRTQIDILRQHPEAIDRQIVRIPVTGCIDPGRQLYSLDRQEILVKRAREWADLDLDEFNKQTYQNDVDNAIDGAVSSWVHIMNMWSWGLFLSIAFIGFAFMWASKLPTTTSAIIGVSLLGLSIIVDVVLNIISQKGRTRYENSLRKKFD